MTGRPSEELLNRIADRLKALGDPMRLRILHELEGGEVCVGDLAQRVGSRAANVSKHLAVLRSAGLVRCRREGMNVCYAVADDGVFEVCRRIRDGLAQQAESLALELRRGTGPPGARGSDDPTATRN